MKVNVPYDFDRIEAHTAIIISDDESGPLFVGMAINFAVSAKTDEDEECYPIQSLGLMLEELPVECRDMIATALQDLADKVRPRH